MQTFTTAYQFEMTAAGRMVFEAQLLLDAGNKRALAPNTPETYEACKPQMEAFPKKVLGHGEFSLEHHSDPRTRFGVTVRVARPS